MPSAPADFPASVHTNTLAELLTRLPASVAVSTYQAGQVVFVRAEGERANTHFRGFDTPMGLAFAHGRLAVGTRTQVKLFADQPAVAAKLPGAGPGGRHDACFLPRVDYHTGFLASHEVAWGGPPESPELWVVNTRFSCLCTLHPDASFVPRWQPPFVSELLPEDRCHLNGVALRDGVPQTVTALGASDSVGEWRPRRDTGGVIVDVPTGEVVLGGLSMPHSPRWHGGELWYLESGRGTLAKLDAAGRPTVVAELPGFTRGLDFAGPFAFVGLSQVRQSNLFAGLPLTDRVPLSERACGLWVVDTRTGESVAFLRFTGGVQEVFAVQVLPGVRYPELLSEPGDVADQSFVLGSPG